MRALRVLGSGARLLRGGYGARAGQAATGAAAPRLPAAWADASPPGSGLGGWGLLPWAATAGARAMSAGTLPDHRRITMPKLSPTMEVGTIASWRKAEGDAIDENDVLAEIDTDKASMEYTYSDTGFLAKVGGRALFCWTQRRGWLGQRQGSCSSSAREGLLRARRLQG